MKKLFFFIFLYLVYFQNNSEAEIINKIQVQGNKNIQTETILEYSDIKLNNDYTSNDLNNIQKKIFETGFFENIKINLSNNILTIIVVENPLINFFNIQGEESSDETNKLYDLIKSGANKIYSDATFKNDLEKIKDYYLNKGYLNAQIEPRLVKLTNGNLNILINIKKEKQLKINKIFFIGDKIFSNSELIEIISSTEDGWWKFLTNTSTVNLNRINYDETLLKNFFLNNGYYDVQISSKNIKKLENNETVDIVFSINAGNLYNFGKFEISKGDNLLDQFSKEFITILNKKLLSKTYSLNNAKTFVDNLNNYFLKNKIENLKINLSETKNNKNIDIELKITNEKRKIINNIEVKGNSVTEEAVIRRNLTFSEGDSYSDYKISKSKDNLQSLNIFKDVKINTDASNEDLVNVIINIIEHPTGSISAGAGVSSDGASLSFAFSEINFLGKNIGLDSNLLIGTQRIRGNVGLQIPDFQNTDKTLYSNIYAQRTEFTNLAYQSNKQGLNISTRYLLFDDIYFKPGFGFNHEDITITSSNASTYVLSQSGKTNTLFGNYNIELDKRDSKFATRNGYILGFNQEIAELLTDNNYIKNNIYGSNFFPLTKKQTFNIKYGYTNITPIHNSSDVKISDRLFVPNQYAKGFSARGFGPKDLSSNTYMGGNNSFYTLASSTFPNPIQESWNLNTIAFINAFNVWGVDNSSIKDSNFIRSSFGVGLDWKSPIGPINISLAKPITKQDSDEAKIFSFEIGTIF